MKKIKKGNILKWTIGILVLLFLMSIDAGVHAQPGPPSGYGQNGDQGAGGTAPLGEGLIFFLVSAMIYGVKKLRLAKKKKE